MTRKHFVAIARILAKHDADLKMVRDFADMCEEHNEHFKRKTFIKACSME
jgi:hypothetical protein